MGPHYLFSFIIADTTHDLLIMDACDTFCDELILLHNMLFQSTVIILLLVCFHEIHTSTDF